jgi:hypothetical protein
MMRLATIPAQWIEALTKSPLPARCVCIGSGRSRFWSHVRRNEQSKKSAINTACGVHRAYGETLNNQTGTRKPNVNKYETSGAAQ